MNLSLNLFLLLLIGNFSNAYAQADCIEEIFALEEKMHSKVTGASEKTSYLKYSVKSVDWDNQVVTSEVKVYKDSKNMHFFSDQANIYQDEKDVFMVLKMQKLIIANSTNQQIANQKLSDDFFELRREFLKSCEVVKCESSPKDPMIKTLHLKVVNNKDESIKITRMIYQYNLKTGEILTTKTFYSEEYKVKEITITYHDINLDTDYKFGAASKYVLNKNQRPLQSFNSYELIDNRK